MSETLLRCPFCGASLKRIGSKRRGNQFYVHDYKGPDCILKEFSFKADDEEKMKQWNTRKPMQNIVERLEEENYRKDGGELFLNHNLEDCIPMKRVYEIVKEEGELHEI